MCRLTPLFSPKQSASFLLKRSFSIIGVKPTRRYPQLYLLLFLRHIQIGDSAFKGFCGHTNTF